MTPDHGRDLEAGDGAVEVGGSDHLDRVAGQGDLLLRLAQGGGDGSLVPGVDPAAGEADLAGMIAHRLGPLGQDDGGTKAIDHRHQHRRRQEVAPDASEHAAFEHVAFEEDRPALPAQGQSLAQPLGQSGHSGSIGKKIPPLHRPALPPPARASSASS